MANILQTTACIVMLIILLKRFINSTATLDLLYAA